MGRNPAFLHSAFPTRDALKHTYARFKLVEAVNVDQVCTRYAMLRDQDWLPILSQFREQFSSPPLECGHQFSAH